VKRPIFNFHLFVAGGVLNSIQARVNLAALCNQYLPGRHEIEVVDVFTQPGRALAENVFMTPTLIKVAPRPAQRIVGTLGNARVVLDVLGLDVAAASRNAG